MKILYVDDEQKMLTRFLEDHAKDGVSVETRLDARKVVQDLSCRQKKDLPDVIVMDLYAANGDFGSPDANRINDEVDRLVDNIAAVRSELEELVSRSKKPIGISVLRDIRKCRKIAGMPVVLRTREGLALLADEILSESVSLRAEWVIKGKGPATEMATISKAIRESNERRRRIERDVLLTIIGALAGFVTSYIFYMVS